MMYAEYRFKKKTKQKTLWKTYTNATKKLEIEYLCSNRTDS